MGKTNNITNRQTVADAGPVKSQFKGDRYFRDGQWDSALTAYTKELQLCKTAGNRAKELILTRQIAETLLNLNEFEGAINNAKRYVHLAKDLQNMVEEQRAYTTLGRIYFAKVSSLTLGENDEERTEAIRSARIAYNKSFSLIQKLKDIPHREVQEMMAVAHLNTGLIYEVDGKFTKAIDHLNHATDICREYKFENLYNCYVALGTLYFHQGDNEKAMANFTLSVNTADSLRDSERMCQSYSDRAKIFIVMKEFAKAKNELTKASQLQVQSMAEDIRIGLKRAKVLCRAEADLINLSESNYQLRKKLYERIGDTLCHMELYSAAIPFYTDMVKCAEMGGDKGQDLADAYISLSRTYNDNKQYDEAVEYYKKELELYADNPKEASRTSVNLGDAMEKSQTNYEYLDIEPHYINGRSYAVQAGSVKLEAIALDCLISLQKSFKLDLLAAEGQKERDLMEVSSSDDEEEPGATPDVDLEDEDLSDDEEFDRSAKMCRPQRSRAPKLQFRRNEKGETPLHRACMEGKLSKVRALINQGHPLNDRDHAGWLPLHEACNHDCREIVEFLLDHGARINDPGGPECGGITPLIDAATCGNLGIVELLLDRGANILTKTREGETALDSLLSWYRRANHKALTPEFMTYFHEIEDRLRRSMSELGYSEDELPSKSIHSKKHSPNTAPVSRISTELKNQAVKEHKSSTTVPNRKSKPIGRLRRAVSVSDSDEDNPRFRSISSDEDSVPSSGISKRANHREDNARFGAEQQSSRSVQERSTYTLKTSSCLVESRCQPLIANTNQEMAPVDDYCNVMKSVRHRNMEADVRHWDAVEPMEEDEVGNVPAFLKEDEIGDDWLEDDLASITSNTRPMKRRKTDKTGVEYLGPGTYAPTSTSRPTCVDNTTRNYHEPSSSRVLLAQPSSRRSPSPTSSPETRLTEFMNIENNSPPNVDTYEDFHVDLTEDLPESSDFQLEGQRKSRPHQVSLLDTGFSRHRTSSVLNYSSTSSRSSRSSYTPLAFAKSPNRSYTGSEFAVPLPACRPAAPLSINVLIEEKLFLVPITLDQNIRDLALEASRRYYRLMGVQPTLSLTTKDGAFLADDDPVSLIVGGDRVLSTVTSWNMPLLTERYSEACKNMQPPVQCDANIQRILVACEATRTLALGDLALAPAQLAPIFTALHEKDKVERINLAGNLLKDDGVKLLTECLKRMSDLTELNLSCNYITSRGLRYFGSLFDAAESKPLQKLALLDLSHNFFGDEASMKDLADILDNVGVKTLNLQSCELSSAMFECSGSSMPPLFCLESVESLNVSYNRLGRDGAASFLGRLNTRQLASLDLASTSNVESTDSAIARELHLFLERERPENLRYLNLSDNHVTDDDIADLVQSLEHADKFHTIIIKNNPISLRSFELLTARCTSLVNLDFSGCTNFMHKQDSDGLVHTGLIIDNQCLSRSIRSLSISCVGEPECTILKSIESMWVRNWGSKSVVNEGPGGILNFSTTTK